MTFNLKTWVRDLFGDREDDSNTVEGYVGRMMSKDVVYEIPPRTAALAALGSYIGQTVSLSASQPLTERVVFEAGRPCKVTAALLMLHTSATVTDTASTAFHVVLNKRGGGVGTYSTTYSVTAYVGGVSSDSGKHGTASHSLSALTQNVARAPNPFLMNPTVASRELTKGDVVTLRVDKGSGSANDSGAIFRGGQIKLFIEEN